MRISDWSSDVCSSDLLARVARLRAAAREHHGPGHVIGDAAPQFTVDEIGDAAEEQTDRGDAGDDVSESEEGKAQPAAIDHHGDDHAEHATVERPAAVPEPENRERVLQVIVEIV